MKGDAGGKSPLETIGRIRDAITRHDLDALTACFSPEYRNETPIHPARGFRGRAQVRTNWQRIMDAVPDIEASILRSAGDDQTAWSEWELCGTRRDGTAFLMRGVGIFGVAGGEATWCRFYLDAVDESSTDIDAATAEAVGAGQSPSEGMQVS